MNAENVPVLASVSAGAGVQTLPRPCLEEADRLLAALRIHPGSHQTSPGATP